MKEETSKGQERERDRKKRASGIEELILQVAFSVVPVTMIFDTDSHPLSGGGFWRPLETPDDVSCEFPL